MRRLMVLLLVAVALASCKSAGGDPGSPSSGRSLKVAFLEDLSLEDATWMVLPAFQGAKLAIDAAARGGLGIELLAEDTGGDPTKAAEVARELVADPSVVAVIVGPYSTGLGRAVSILDAAGMPVVSLSTLSPFQGSAPPPTWFGAVDGAVGEADVLAGYLEAAAGGGTICLGDPAALDGTLTSLLAAQVSQPTMVGLGRTNGETDFRSAAAEVADADCAVLFWDGSGPEAALLRTAMDAADLGGVSLVGADLMKDPEFLSEAGVSGDGTVVACACVDITSSTDLAARRFIQDYQANFGLPPGPYSAEAYDAAQRLVGILDSGAQTRSAVAAGMRGSGGYLGLVASYELGPSVSPTEGTAREHLFRDVGGRWLSVPA